MKMKSVILFIALVILSAGWLDGPSAADKPLEDRHVIDWHAHAAGLGYGGSGAFINEQLRNNFRFRFFLKWMGATQKELAAEGDQIIICRLSEALSRSKYVDQVVVLEKAVAHAHDDLSDPQKLALPLRHGVTVISSHSHVVGIPATKHSKMRQSSAAITWPGRSTRTPDSAPYRPALSGRRP